MKLKLVVVVNRAMMKNKADRTEWKEEESATSQRVITTVYPEWMTFEQRFE